MTHLYVPWLIPCKCLHIHICAHKYTWRVNPTWHDSLLCAINVCIIFMRISCICVHINTFEFFSNVKKTIYMYKKITCIFFVCKSVLVAYLLFVYLYLFVIACSCACTVEWQRWCFVFHLWKKPNDDELSFTFGEKSCRNRVSCKKTLNIWNKYTYTSQALERDTPIGTMGTSLGELKYVYCGRSIDMITTYFGANMNIYTREHIYVTPMGTSLGENKYVYYERNIDMITIYFGTNMNIFTREHMYTRHLWAPH